VNAQPKWESHIVVKENACKELNDKRQAANNGTYTTVVRGYSVLDLHLQGHRRQLVQGLLRRSRVLRHSALSSPTQESWPLNPISLTPNLSTGPLPSINSLLPIRLDGECTDRIAAVYRPFTSVV
jgi:hypothetical protein